MSDVTKKDLRELAEKATRGPWWIDSHGHRMSTEDGMVTVFIADDRMGKATRHPETGNLSHWPNDWDASFIASANPKTIIGLLDEIEALEAELSRVKGEYEWVASINTALDESNQSAWIENAKLRAELERRVPDIAGWLWHWLMDYCKKNCQPPATRNDLFAVVSDLRKTFTAAPATVQGVNQQLLEAVTAAFEFINKSGEHDSVCDVFDLDDDDRHKDCNCGLDATIRALYAAIAAARKGEGE